jgi:hypothetical protein
MCLLGKKFKKYFFDFIGLKKVIKHTFGKNLKIKFFLKNSF